MRNKIIIAVIFIFSFGTAAFAEISIKAEVNKTIITTDEPLTYKLIINSSEKNTPVPRIPKFESFQVVSRVQSSSMSFAKNKVKNSLVYTFILVPANIGKLKIEPSVIKIKNQAYSTAGFEIEVKQGRRKPPAKLQQRPSLPEKTQPETPKTTL